MKTIRLRSLALAILVATVTGCAYHNPTQPTPPAVSDTTPAFLTVSVPVGGSTLVTAYVQNAHGAPVPGVVVKFASTVGTLEPTAAPTGTDGRAVSNLTAASEARVTATTGTLTARAIVEPPAAPVPPPGPVPPVPPTPLPTPPPTAPPSVFLNVSNSATTGVPLPFGVSSSATGVVWQWSFGDGATAQTAAFITSHAYTAAGSYTASVSGAGTSTASATITVTDPVVPPTPPTTPAPTPALSVSVGASPSSVFVGASANLTATVTRQNGAPPPATYAWDCNGDGVTIVTTASATQSCTYSNPGSVTSRVTVTGGSVTGSGSTVVTVGFAPLSVNIAAPVPVVTAGLTNTFTATASSGAALPSPLQWQWDFQNDGVIDTTASAAGASNSQGFVYTTTGSKTVKVIVTDLATGRTATNTVVITVP